MTPEELVPTLETCKLLKEAGYEKSTYFSYQNTYSVNAWRAEPSCFFLTEHLRIPAPTLQELLEELPVSTTQNNITYYLIVNGKCAGYYSEETHTYLYIFELENLAEAAALLWLELRKEGA